MRTRWAEQPDASAAQRDRRLRAVYRRELQESVHFSALVVTALSLPLIAAGLAAAYVSRCRARLYVVPIGMMVGLLPVVSCVESVLLPGSEPLALGTLGLIPVAFAIFIPLQRKQHLAWLGELTKPGAPGAAARPSGTAGAMLPSRACIETGNGGLPS